MEESTQKRSMQIHDLNIMLLSDGPNLTKPKQTLTTQDCATGSLCNKLVGLMVLLETVCSLLVG
jgi:hypothetical protein